MFDTNEKDEDIEIDNKKLIEDLNELEDDENSKKNRTKQKLKENFIIILVIICLLAGAFFYCYKKSYENDDYYIENDEYISRPMYDETMFYEEIGNTLIENSEGINNSIESYDFENTNNDFEEEFSDITEYGNYEYYEKKEMSRFETIKSNMPLNIANSVNNEIIATIKNNNSETVYEILLYAVFYNENNQIIKIVTDSIDCLKSNDTYYWKIEEAPTNYSRYDIFYDKEYYDIFEESEYITNDISYTDSLENGNVILKVSNNSEVNPIFAIFTIAYYDSQNNLLDIEKIETVEIPKKKKINIKGAGVWNFEEKKDILFDRYEVVLEGAYNIEY